MGDLVKIIRENNNVDAVIQTLNESKNNIKDIFCAIRFNDGGLMLLDANVPFETLCTISKKLDLIIDYRQQEDDEIDEDEELEDGE